MYKDLPVKSFSSYEICTKAQVVFKGEREGFIGLCLTVKAGDDNLSLGFLYNLVKLFNFAIYIPKNIIHLISF